MNTVIINNINDIPGNKLAPNFQIYINIDTGFMVPEYVLYRACQNSVAMKNKIMKNTKNNTNKLIVSKHDYNDFLNKYNGHKIFLVTHQTNIEFGESDNMKIISFDELNNVLAKNKNNAIYLNLNTCSQY